MRLSWRTQVRAFCLNHSLIMNVSKWFERKWLESQYVSLPYPCAQESGFKPLLRYTVRGWPVARSMLHFVNDHSVEPNNAVVTYSIS